MAAAGFTPISLYYSTTASAQPTAPNLALGELAVNITDGKLFYKTVGGVITLLASASSAQGNASNILGGTTGAIVYQSALNTTTFLSIGASTHILTSNGTLPVYTNPASITVGNATTAGSATTAGTATNIVGGTTSALVYQSAVGTTAFLPLGTNTFILTSNGTVPTYTNPSSITVGTATTAGSSTNVLGGLANQIVYQTAPNTSGFAPVPTIPGYVLSWNGSAFTWVPAPAALTAANLTGGGVGTVVYQSATSVTAFAPAGANGQLFTYNTSLNRPEWTTPTVTVGSTVINVNGAAAATLAGLTSVTVTQDPTSELQLATKQYVDTVASAGIHIHQPVNTDSNTNLAATYVGGGTTPTITNIAGGTILTIPLHGLVFDDQVVPTTTANGLVAGTPYYVYSVVNANQVTLSATAFGSQITTLTNGTGLSIGLNANTGVGATLTSTGTGPLVLKGYTNLLGNRVLILGQTNQAQNGVYDVTQLGVVGVSPWILTRSANENKYSPNSINGLGAGDFFLVLNGTDAGNSYVCSTPGDIIFGVTAIVFSQFGTGNAVATNLAGGVASQIPYQTGASTTAFIANGTAGQVLVSNGTAAPAWQTLAVADNALLYYFFG